MCFNPCNLKNKIMKIEHKKIFRGPSKISKKISWPINIFLKYFIVPTKTLRPKDAQKKLNKDNLIGIAINLQSKEEYCNKDVLEEFKALNKKFVRLESGLAITSNVSSNTINVLLSRLV